MSLVQYTKHVDDTKTLLLETFKTSLNFIAWINSYIKEIQILEDLFFSLLEDRRLDTAFGAQLANLGAIVGITQADLTDDEYRQRIKVQIKVNVSSGLSNDLLTILQILYPSSRSTITDYYPAACVVESTTATTLAHIDKIILESAKPAGVFLQYIYALDKPDFQYSSYLQSGPIFWTAAELFSAISGSFIRAFYDSVLDTFFVIGKDRIVKSQDGENWSTLIQTFNTSTDITRFNNKLILCEENSGIVYSSTNGIDWTSATLASGSERYCCAANDSIVVIMGLNYVHYSSDGITYNTISLGSTFTINSVIWSDVHSIFVAVGWVSPGGVYIITSPNGIVWTLSTSGLYANANIKSILYRTSDAKFYTFGDNGSNQVVIFSSPDAVNWTVEYTSATTSNIGFYNKSAFACQDDTMIFPWLDGMIWSIDGVNWNTGDGGWVAAAYNSTTHIAALARSGVLERIDYAELSAGWSDSTDTNIGGYHKGVL